MTPQTLTLTGYLGSDREIRWTPERTEWRTRWNEVAEMEDEIEVTIPARAYAVLSLATQQQVEGQWKTVWHRLVVWDVYRTQEWIAVRIARKGDKIQVTGTLDRFEAHGRTLEQLVVQSFRHLAHKIHEEQP